MWYAIIAEDTPNSLEKRLAARQNILVDCRHYKMQVDCFSQVLFQVLIATTQAQQGSQEV